MSRTIASPEIENLISYLAKLPGLGPRSARRAALHLLKRREQLMSPLTEAMSKALANVKQCTICGALDTISPCSICIDESRNKEIILVVEDVADMWALERASNLKCKYHILGGVLSPLDGIGPDDLNITKLQGRVTDSHVKEVILALSATVDGQTTAHYVTDQLNHTKSDLKVTRLAHGVPVGGELDYLDDGTLSQALQARTLIE